MNISSIPYELDRRGRHAPASTVSESDDEMASSSSSIPRSVAVANQSGPSNQDPIALIQQLEENYLEKRDELISPEGYIITPMKMLRDLAYEWKQVVNITTFEIHLPRQNIGLGQEGVINRVQLSIGAYQGDGEASRHRLALQMAAADLLEKIKVNLGTDLPMYGLPPGYRISPRIYTDLNELSRYEEFPQMPSFSQLDRTDVLELEIPSMFAFVCKIGYMHMTGASDSMFLAKRIAAKQAFEALTGETYPDDRVATGDGCLMHEDLTAMGITPVKSMREKEIERAMKQRNDGQEPATGLIRPRIYDDEDGLFEDDFAETEDGIAVMRHELEKLKITTTKPGIRKAVMDEPNVVKMDEDKDY